MRRNTFRQTTARIAVVAFLAGMMQTNAFIGDVQAAAKLSLSKKKVEIGVGKTVKISVKNAKKLKVRSVTCKIDKKKIAAFKKSGRYAVKVKAKKQGKAVLTFRVKRGKKWSSLKCNIVVKANKKAEPTPKQDNATTQPTGQPTNQPTNQPTQIPDITPEVTPTSKPTQKPTAEPTPGTGFQPVEYKKADFETGTDGFVGRGGSEKLGSVDGGHTGKCLKVTGRTQNWHGASIDVTDTIVKGATYGFSAWVRQDSGEEKPIKLSCTLDETYPEVKTLSCKSGEWTHLEGTYEVPTSFQSLTFYFEGPGGNYDLLIDDVVIRQETEGKAGLDPMSLESLKDAYQKHFTRFGTCISYNTSWNQGTQMQSDSTMKFVQKQFNSFTLENEMKPDQIFNRFTGAPISVADAKARGYVIPDSYKEATVPQLNFSSVDKSLEIADKYGIQMRAHVLLWHQQTNPAFFRTGYTETGAVVSKEVMDARLEFYIRTVMKHVMEKEKTLSAKKAGSIVYCWDVANEYIHRSNAPTSPSWVDVYGDMGLAPTYVKKAFSVAYDMLKEYGLQDTVTLFYNDYDEYDWADDIVSLVKYINQGEPANICGGIGMQSHITTKNPTLEVYGNAVDKFLLTGLEVQVTELDMGIEQGDTQEIQAERYGDIMELLIQKHKNRDVQVNKKGITGVTIWGLLDSKSWRKDEQPILFAGGLDQPKPSFYSVLEAAKK